ncbi:MAG: hypothetical protein AB7I35_01510 [Ramlibacter sp.]
MTGPTTATPTPCDLDYLRLRAEPCGDCLEWRATLSKESYPIISLRVPDGQGGREQRQFYVRHLVFWLTRGAPPADRRYVITTTCRNKLCIAPAHVVRVLRGTVYKQAAAAGAWKSAAYRAKVSAGKLRNSQLTDAGVARIRAHEGSLATLAQELQISEAYAYMIRRGTARKGHTGPWAGLMAAAERQTR